MIAGSLRERVSFYRDIQTQDEIGGNATQRIRLFTIFGQVRPVKSSYSETTNQIFNLNNIEIDVRYSKILDLKINDLAMLNNNFYRINSILPNIYQGKITIFAANLTDGN